MPDELAARMFAMPGLTIALCTLLLALPLAAERAHAQLRGHGGPVRAVAVAPDGKSAITGSFDQSAIRWSLTRNAAAEVLRFHDGAVNAVAILADGRVATAGEDGRIALFSPGREMPDRVLDGHGAPVVGLALSPDGTTLASASWDRTVRLWPFAGGQPRVLEGHQQSVNGVAFLPDGRAVVSAGYDAMLRIWPLDRNQSPLVVQLPAPLNAVAIAPDGEIVTAGADGTVRFATPAGDQQAAVAAQSTPVIALAVSADGLLVAAAGIRGTVAIIGRAERKLIRTLVGPGLPVWALAFMPDSRTLITGGTDRVVRRWDTVTGTHIGSDAVGEAGDPLAAFAGERGAEVFRACAAWTSYGHPRRWQSCSNSARQRSRPGPRCPSSASLPRRTEPRSSISSRGRHGDKGTYGGDNTDGMKEGPGPRHPRGRHHGFFGHVDRRARLQ
jgi:cytochrome c